MLLAYIFATIDKKTHCGLSLHNDHNKSGNKSHGVMLECMEASMAAAYTDQILCCCSVPFHKKCYALL
eukprot:15337992-Ditylum_brightwellii.AAC.1